MYQATYVYTETSLACPGDGRWENEIMWTIGEERNLIHQYKAYVPHRKA